MSIAPAEAPTRLVLNAKHRCDACGSRAYIATVLRASVTLPNGGELMFCAHHFREHAEALIPYLAALIDETSQLTMHVKDDGHV